MLRATDHLSEVSAFTFSSNLLGVSGALMFGASIGALHIISTTEAYGID